MKILRDGKPELLWAKKSAGGCLVFDTDFIYYYSLQRYNVLLAHERE